MSTPPEERIAQAQMDIGAARALAEEALNYLALGATSDDVQVAASLLSGAAKRADHGALMLRLAKKASAPVDQGGE